MMSMSRIRGAQCTGVFVCVAVCSWCLVCIVFACVMSSATTGSVSGVVFAMCMMIASDDMCDDACG